LALAASRRSRTTGLAASLLAHVVFVAFLLTATQRPSPPEPVRTTDVQVVRNWPSLPRRPAPASRGSTLAVRAHREQDAAPPAPPVHELPPAIAAAPSLSPSPSPDSAPDDAERRGLASALRGSIGCASAQLAGLTSAEQQHCRDRFAKATAGVHDGAELGIDPIKRAAFDASWTADHSPQHMAGVACLAVFGKGGLKWLHPSEGVKLGPLPCYAYTPKATFSANPEHARGW
jgi:hypothetical protein